MKDTIRFEVDPKKPQKEVIYYAAVAIRGGRLVAFPTETVYGIAANRRDPKALRALDKAKNRPKDKHYTVHISDVNMIGSLGCRIGKPAKKLVDKYWPGPLTIILKSRSGEKIGFRMPANKVALQLIAEAKVPIVAPSANVSGHPAPTNASAVIKDLDGKIDMVIDAGSTKIGVESTVVDLTINPPKILRQGAIKL